MSPYRRVLYPAMLALAAAISGCERSGQSSSGGSAHAPRSEKPTIYVVNYPLEYFAERIVGDTADVVFPVPPDADPAYWKPAVTDIAAYQQADLILLNGAGYARWVEHATLPPSKVLDTSAAFRDQYIELQDAAKHAHGPEGEHAHTGSAFTTWLDPKLAVRHAAAIRDSLAKLMPDQAEALNRNFEALKQDLDSLDARFEQLTRGRNDQPLLASHPVYQYFACRYRLNLKSLHWEPDEVPPAPQWSELDKLLQEHDAKWMIWEAPPEPETADKLRERGVRCAVLHPCGNTPEGSDYLHTMRRNIESLKPVFP